MSDYPAGLNVRPLCTWPGKPTPPGSRQRSQFSATLRQTLQLLDRELWNLSAKHPVLEVAIEPQQFRLDGRPRMGAKAAHPGIVLSLPTTRHGALRYPSDRFTTWQDNLRAVALGLEALRKVDRYGITPRAEQYAGFKAIGPGDAVAMPAAMSVDDAARVLCELGGVLATSAPEVVRDTDARAHVYRRAVRTHHPDRGGDRAQWDRLEQAKRILDEHGGRA